MNYIFSQLKYHHNFRLVLDPTPIDIDTNAFKKYCKWKQFYCNARELWPPNASKTTGNGFIICSFVDEDFPSDSLTTRRSQC